MSNSDPTDAPVASPSAPSAPSSAAALPPIEPLFTPRLVLREVAEADLDDLLVVNGDAAVTTFLPYATWASRADAQAWLQRMQALTASGSARQLVLQRRDDGRVIGGVLMFRHYPGSRRLELGYVLGRAHWGGGWMHEALQGLCSFAFGPLGLRRLEAEVQPANGPSQRLLERLGFVREGRLRQRWEAKGRAYDTDLFGLLADEWAAASRSASPSGPAADTGAGAAGPTNSIASTRAR